MTAVFGSTALCTQPCTVMDHSQGSRNEWCGVARERMHAAGPQSTLRGHGRCRQRFQKQTSFHGSPLHLRGPALLCRICMPRCRRKRRRACLWGCPQQCHISSTRGAPWQICRFRRWPRGAWRCARARQKACSTCAERHQQSAVSRAPSAERRQQSAVSRAKGRARMHLECCHACRLLPCWTRRMR
jgi:hypothetical protein